MSQKLYFLKSLRFLKKIRSSKSSKFFKNIIFSILQNFKMSKRKNFKGFFLLTTILFFIYARVIFCFNINMILYWFAKDSFESGIFDSFYVCKWSLIFDFLKRELCCNCGKNLSETWKEKGDTVVVYNTKREITVRSICTACVHTAYRELWDVDRDRERRLAYLFIKRIVEAIDRPALTSCWPDRHSEKFSYTLLTIIFF